MKRCQKREGQTMLLIKAKNEPLRLRTAHPVCWVIRQKEGPALTNGSKAGPTTTLVIAQ